MNNQEASIAALVGGWTEPGETIVQGVQRVVELLHMNAELNSTLIMRTANPDYLPMTTREALDRIKELQDERDKYASLYPLVEKCARLAEQNAELDVGNGVLVDRIKALGAALRPLTDAGDGYYVGWRGGHSFNAYGPFCIYCNTEWDRYTDTPPDRHTQNCPIVIARDALGGDA